MAGLGLPELLIILAIVLLIFGVGRIARVGGELGKGVSAFRQGMREGQEEEKSAGQKSDGPTNGDKSA